MDFSYEKGEILYFLWNDEFFSQGKRFVSKHEMNCFPV
ncbi:unknown [Bacteroides intestinalis CAG:315]|jgi:hypothetical protein|nr:unknown [Bacteroides intestinalis CAG:315]